MGYIATLPIIHRWLHMAVARPASPHVEAWVARLAKRPGYANALTLPVT